MHFVFGVLADLFLGWIWWLIPEEVDRRNDLKRFADGEVRCSMRAMARRVLNIGTEWSGGVAQVERGMLRFSPSVGIVGDRVVPVHSIRNAPSPNPLSMGGAPLGGASGGIGTRFIVTTTGGELLVSFPTVVADDVAALLAGTPFEAEPTKE